MNDQGFHMFERLTALVAREGIAAGETGEVSRVYGDGSIELEVMDRVGPATFSFLGLRTSEFPFSRRLSARFAPDEVRRAGN